MQRIGELQEELFRLKHSLLWSADEPLKQVKSVPKLAHKSALKPHSPKESLQEFVLTAERLLSRVQSKLSSEEQGLVTKKLGHLTRLLRSFKNEQLKTSHEVTFLQSQQEILRGKQLETLKKKHQEKSDSLHVLQQEYCHLARLFKAKNTQRRAETSEVKAKLTALCKSTHASLTETYCQLETKVELISNRIQSAKVCIKRLKPSRSTPAILKHENDRLRQELQSMKLSLRLKENKAKSLAAQLAEAQDGSLQTQQVTRLQQQVEHLISINEDLSRTIVQKDALLDDKGALLSSIQASAPDIAEFTALQARLSEYAVLEEDRKEQHQQELAELCGQYETRIHELETELEHWTSLFACEQEKIIEDFEQSQFEPLRQMYEELKADPLFEEESNALMSTDYTMDERAALFEENLRLKRALESCQAQANTAQSLQNELHEAAATIQLLQNHAERLSHEHQLQLAACKESSPDQLNELKVEVSVLKERLLQKQQLIERKSTKIKELREIFGSKHTTILSSTLQGKPENVKLRAAMDPTELVGLLDQYEHILGTTAELLKIHDAAATPQVVEELLVAHEVNQRRLTEYT